MALNDYSKFKPGDVTSLSGTPSFSGYPFFIRIEGGSTDSTGTGVCQIDTSDTTVNGPEDIQLLDENDNSIDYYWVTFDTTNDIYEAWGRKTIARDGSTGIKVAYGNGSTDNSVSEATVWDGVPDLIGRWSYNQTPDTDSGTNEILDSSSNNLDGDSTGTSQTTGVFGNALNLDGTDDAVMIPDNDLLSFDNATSGQDDPMTFMMWLNPDANFSNTNTPFLMGKGDDSNTNREYLLRASGSSNGTLSLLLYGPDFGNRLSVYGTTKLSANTTYHAAWTYDGSQNSPGGFNVYVNATSESLTDDSSGGYGGQSNYDDPLIIGDAFSTSNVPFDGWLDEIHMYRAEKSADYIQTHYDMSPEAGYSLFSWNASQSLAISLEVNDSVGFQEELKINGDLSGTVTLGGTGVSGADVIVYDLTDGTFLGSTTTDANGNYSFAELAPNDRYLIAVHYYDTGTSTRYADAKTERPTG